MHGDQRARSPPDTWRNEYFLHCYKYMRKRRKHYSMNTHMYPHVGQRIRLRHDVPRFDEFIAKKGMTGTVNKVNQAPQEALISVKMDQPLSDDPQQQAAIEEEWENCIYWEDVLLLPRGMVTALEDFLDDCEYIE